MNTSEQSIQTRYRCAYGASMKQWVACVPPLPDDSVQDPLADLRSQVTTTILLGPGPVYARQKMLGLDSR